MADKLAVKDRVSVTEDDKEYLGNVTEVNGKECTIKFDGIDEPEEHRIANVQLLESAAAVEAKEAEAQKLADEQKAKEEIEAKEKAETEATARDSIEDSISVPKSKVDLRKFKGNDDPNKIAAEMKKQEGLSARRKVNRIKKIKVAAAKKPIDARRDYLKAKLKDRGRFKKEQVDMMARELLIITNDPGGWSQGCVKPKKQPSALDKLDKVLRS